MNRPTNYKIAIVLGAIYMGLEFSGLFLRPTDFWFSPLHLQALQIMGLPFDFPMYAPNVASGRTDIIINRCRAGNKCEEQNIFHFLNPRLAGRLMGNLKLEGPDSKLTDPVLQTFNALADSAFLKDQDVTSVQLKLIFAELPKFPQDSQLAVQTRVLAERSYRREERGIP